MKKTLAILLATMLLFSFAACGNKENPDDTTSTPTSTPSASQGGNTEENQNDGQNESQNNSQGGTQSGTQSGNQNGNSNTVTPPVIEDTNKEDITAYVPYGATSNGDDDSQYFPPQMDSSGNMSPGVTIGGLPFELPEFFEVEKAIRICKSKNTTVTVAKLAEFANEYAKAYNKYYSTSNYKLTVSASGNVIKYTYTVSGKPAERRNYIIEGRIEEHIEKNNAFYKAQVKKYKDTVSSCGGIEICIVRADNDPNLNKADYNKNITTIKVS